MDEWSHASMISNAQMEQWPVWYDGGKREVGLIADRRRVKPLKSNKYLVEKRAEAGFCFSFFFFFSSYAITDQGTGYLQVSWLNDSSQPESWSEEECTFFNSVCLKQTHYSHS